MFFWYHGIMLMLSCLAPSQAEKQFQLLEEESNSTATEGVISWLVSGLSIEESQ
jgi:hypothetical protein